MTEVLARASTPPVELGVAEDVIQGMRARYENVDANTKAGYEIARQGISELTKLRSQVEQARKDLKRDAIDWGKRVDAEARRVKDLILEVEQPLRRKKEGVDEAERLQREAEQRRIDEERAAKQKAEQERRDREAREQREAEEKRLADERAKLLAEQEKLRKEREAVTAERRKLEEQRRIKEEAERAKRENEERAAREKAEQEEAERRAAEDAEEQKRRVPDMLVLRQLGDSIHAELESLIPVTIVSQMNTKWGKSQIEKADELFSAGLAVLRGES